MVTRARLRRRTEHRLVAGVAGGIADRLNAPVAFVRFFIWLATLPAPWLLWGYAGAALLIPPAARDRPDWDNLIGLARLGTIVGVPALAFGGRTYWNEPLGGPAGWWLAYYGLLAAGALALLGADYSRGCARSPAEARSAVLASLPVAGCAVALAAAMLLVPDFRWERWVPAAALVGAAAVLVGAWRGRTDGFLTPAILCLAVTGFVIAGEARLEGGIGDARVAPSAGDGQVPVVARRAVGDLALDLRRLRGSGGAVIVEASVGVGTLSVAVAEGARVELVARVGQGAINPRLDPDGTRAQGFDRQLTATYLPNRRHDAPAAAPIRLQADVGAGQIEIGRGGEILEGPSG